MGLRGSLPISRDSLKSGSHKAEFDCTRPLYLQKRFHYTKARRENGTKEENFPSALENRGQFDRIRDCPGMKAHSGKASGMF